MTMMSVELIMERIKIATPDSPIAVFRCLSPLKFNAVFAETYETRRWIREGVFPLVGVYHNRMNTVHIQRFLQGLITEREVVHEYAR